MAITYLNEGIGFPLIKKREITAWIKEVARSYEKKAGDITYIFCSDNKILKINREFLKHDYFTDIITFDYSERKTISGDIFISLETVKSNSEEYQTDYITELHRVIIHGILHLCGLKDKSPEEKRKMTEAEDKALDMLDKPTVTD